MENILNLDNARSFNSSLKKAILKATNEKVGVSIVNSYKFPHCWVQVYCENELPNDLKLKVFDACGFDRKHLSNENEVFYGNIRGKHVSALVSNWVKVFNQ